MPITINGSGTITGVSVGGLPDGIVDTDMLAANAVATAKIADSAVTSAKSTGLGISSAQNFRLAASESGSGNTGTVLTNWEEVDTEYSAIGSVWSQSSGIFSTTTTGIYLCMFQQILTGSVSSGDAFDPNVQISTDSGSNYTTRAHGWAYATNSQVDAAGNQFMFDVTDASTFRLRMRQSDTNDTAPQSTIEGSTSENATHIMLIRLGDT